MVNCVRQDPEKNFVGLPEFLTYNNIWHGHLKSPT